MLPKARKTNVLVTEVGDEVVVFDQLFDRAHRLNPTAAAVWRQADGNSSVEDLATQLAGELGVPDDPKFVWIALGQLEEAGLLEKAVDLPRLSRRDAVKVLAGVAAFLVPAVTSIVAPLPVMAQSGGTTEAEKPLECDPRYENCEEKKEEEEEGEGEEEKASEEEEGEGKEEEEKVGEEEKQEEEEEKEEEKPAEEEKY